jgi:hypothetical protein
MFEKGISFRIVSSTALRSTSSRVDRPGKRHLPDAQAGQKSFRRPCNGISLKGGSLA